MTAVTTCQKYSLLQSLCIIGLGVAAGFTLGNDYVAQSYTVDHEDVAMITLLDQNDPVPFPENEEMLQKMSLHLMNGKDLADIAPAAGE